MLLGKIAVSTSRHASDFTTVPINDSRALHPASVARVRLSVFFDIMERLYAEPVLERDRLIVEVSSPLAAAMCSIPSLSDVAT
jgi:hypothetical protein